MSSAAHVPDGGTGGLFRRGPSALGPTPVGAHTGRMRTSGKGSSKTDLALELLVAFGLQLGLSRLLSAACTYAEEHELEPARAASARARRLLRPVSV